MSVSLEIWVFELAAVLYSLYGPGKHGPPFCISLVDLFELGRKKSNQADEEDRYP